MESKWSEGVWLGHHRCSSEVLIGTRTGVVKAWTVRRKPQDARWDADLIKSIKGTPQRWSEEEPGEERPIEVAVEELDDEEHDQLADIKSGERKSMYLKKSDFERHCLSEGCEGCRKIASGKPAPYPHTRVCMRSLESIIKQEDPVRWKTVRS